MLRQELKDWIARLLENQKCESLIAYQSNAWTIKGIGVDSPILKLSLAEFSRKPILLQVATRSAQTLDDFQYHLCRERNSRRLDDPFREWLGRVMIAALALYSSFRVALDASTSGLANSEALLSKSVTAIQDFTTRVSSSLLTPPPPPIVYRDALTDRIGTGGATHERTRAGPEVFGMVTKGQMADLSIVEGDAVQKAQVEAAVSDALRAVDVTDADVDEVLSISRQAASESVPGSTQRADRGTRQ